MDVGTLFLVLLLLACPLMMVFMHRGGHGAHGGHDHGHHVDGRAHAHSLEELRGQREAIDTEIARIESEQPETETESEKTAPTTA